MGKCWTCGSDVDGFMYTCSTCRNISYLKKINENLSSKYDYSLKKLDDLTKIQEEGFNELSKTISEGLSEIVSVLEWGFGEVSWYIHQQTEVLRSIDHTLKTPSETQANEWRRMAEELRRRAVLSESEEFYLKALDLNRLDYRLYVGLAETYLHMNNFEKAKHYLEKSLPHAPDKEINYKSYSYKLIGHIEFCNENYSEAVKLLKIAIELSPNYSEAYYDYAQYCAQERDLTESLNALQKAISDKTLFFYLALNEKNFNLIRNDIDKLLSEIKNKPKVEVEKKINESQRILDEAKLAYGSAQAKNKHLAESWHGRDADNLLKQAISLLSSVKRKIASDDYVSILESKPIAEESLKSSKKALEHVIRYADYKPPRKPLIRFDIDINFISAIKYMFLFGIIGWFITGFASCFYRVLAVDYGYRPLSVFSGYTSEGVYGLIIGGIIGFIIGSRKL